MVVPNSALRFAPPGTGTSGMPMLGNDRPNLNDGKHRVWILRGKVPEPVEVRIGLTDGSVTEILSDQLKEGMQVLTEVRESA